MPLTPFHMGAGLLAKALLRSSFSLLVFGWSQVLIDLEPLVALTTGRGEVHGFSHTWLGALLIGTVAMVTGMPAANWVLSWASPDRARPLRVSWKVAAVSAYIGTASHILLDGFMHADMYPFAPWSDAQPGLGAVSVGDLYLACVVMGAVGAGVWGAYLWRSRQRTS